MAMTLFKNMKLRHKLPAAIAAIAVTGAGAIGTVSYLRADAALFEQAEDSLRGTERALVGQLDRMVETVRVNIDAVGDNRATGLALTQLSNGHQVFQNDVEVNARERLQTLYVAENPNPPGARHRLSDAGDGSFYSAMHADWHGWLDDYRKARGYRNLFLVNADMEVIYAAEKEGEFGATLSSGRFADSALTRVVREAMATADEENAVAVSSFDFYEMAGDTPVSFVADDVRNDQGEVIGAVVFQLTLNGVQAVLDNVRGLGETGEAYLVGPDGRARSQLGLVEDGESTALTRRIDTEPARRALAGEQGVVEAVDYSGATTLAAYGPLDYFGETWGVVAKMDMTEVAAPMRALRNSALITVLVIGSLAAGLGVLLARTIVRPVQAMQDGLARVRDDRDLTVRLGTDAKDEIGAATRSVDEILDFVRQSLVSIRTSAGETSVVSDQLSDAAQSTASNSEIQSSAVEEISSSLEETDSQVKANADSARQADEVVAKTADAALKGKDDIAEMSTAMNEINTASQDIAKIIKVIDDIAFQTNLLALNAAVEAARAGQHGRGFAVVAQEVRNLAARSAKAAKETSELIDGTTKRVDRGVELATVVTESFESVADDVQRIKTLVTEISSANDEQARGVAQINTAIAEVTKTAQETSQQSEELAATAEELSKTTDQVLSDIRAFELGEAFDLDAMKREVRPAGERATPAAEAGGAGTRRAAPDVIALDERAKPEASRAQAGSRSNGRANGHGNGHANGHANGAARPQDRLPLDHDERGYGDF
ncbi:methyl-accepting chemotaxis protein [Rhodosalinus sediminis]|uniref:Methyl-accepting chemotaxis protein n=1 Tax=Rhodosalinus sediminis TaxID=1940533 RepID=A0A3D9BYB3_9RHOB|nr:methyl-accepting chemotaxis protein [Rhodosalinus sediminis]REC58351.1 methyl-accepting chemotaxis protein [Rhodosalinus sediminis]